MRCHGGRTRSEFGTCDAPPYNLTHNRPNAALKLGSRNEARLALTVRGCIFTASLGPLGCVLPRLLLVLGLGPVSSCPTRRRLPLPTDITGKQCDA